MEFEIGKRVWVKPLKMWATIETIWHTDEWDGEDEKKCIGNIRVLYDDGVLGECNNWQLGEKEK